MQKENIREYGLVRKEMADLRNCITSYVGFLIGGSGLAFTGLVLLEKKPGTLLVQIGVPLVLATLITLVQMIIYYKFLSHNRYAGYCKLLNHEQHIKMNVMRDSSDGDIILWEACMDILRRSDRKPNYKEKHLNNTLKGIVYGTLCKCGIVIDKEKDFKEILGDVLGEKPPADKWKRLKGFKYICNMFGSIKTDSWPFPAFVNNIFIVLAPLFIMTAFYFLCTNTHPTIQEWSKAYSVWGAITRIWEWLWAHSAWAAITRIWEWSWVYSVWVAITLIVFICHIYTWIILAGKLFTLLEGSNTVNNFCWKFLPFRIGFLNDSRKISPEYFFRWCPIHDKKP